MEKKRNYRQRDLESPLNILTESQQRTLELLARYRYITTQQLIDAGVSKNIGTIRNHVLYRLCKRAQKNLVQVQDYFATNSRFGRLPYIYSLTEYGAEFVAEMWGVPASEVRYPVGKIQFVADYHHRTAYIDFCIAVDKWADSDPERDVLEMLHYYDKTGANRRGLSCRSVTRVLASEEVGEIEPDGLLLLNTGHKSRALAVEIHNTTDTKRIIQQLAKHSHAINTGSISKKLGHNSASFVLSVSMNPAQAKLVKTRFEAVEGFNGFKKLFAFSDLETIKEKGFELAFTHSDNQQALIFSKQN